MLQMQSGAPRYFLDRNYGGGAQRELTCLSWDRTLPAELRYPFDVLEMAHPHVTAQGLHYYFTKDAYRLPEYGPHVVAVLLQEERCKIPVYGRYIRATVRNCSSRPFIGFRPHAHAGRLEALLLFEYARDWYTHWKSVRAGRHAPTTGALPVRDDACVMHLPLGYHSQDELAQVPMHERPLDLFFAGQVKEDIPRSDYRHWTSTSKLLARAQLWAELDRLQRTRRWNFDLGNIGATENVSRAPVFNSYSEKMLRTRICVAPRGTIAETYRAYEGLRAGCLVVANRLPGDPYLDDAPILQVDHWRELEVILDKYARDIDLLEKARARSLAWWEGRASPRVIGSQVAQFLNCAGASLHEPD